jgi:hypothetical protein
MASEVARPLTRQKTSVGEGLGSGGRRAGMGEREKTTLGVGGGGGETGASAGTTSRHRGPLSQGLEPTFYIGGGNGVAM